MAITIVGYYDNPAFARKVASELQHSDVEWEDVHVFVHDETGALEETPVREYLRGETAGVGSSAFTGDFINTLIERGVPRSDAEMYAEGVRRGGGVVIIFDAEEHMDDAVRILNKYEPVDREARREAWEERGYTGLDYSAPLYTAEQVKAERRRYTEHTGGTAYTYKY